MLTHTFFDQPPLVIWIEKHLRHFVCSFVILKWLGFDGIIVGLGEREREMK